MAENGKVTLTLVVDASDAIRRIQLLQMSIVELSIQQSRMLIERLPADPLLTEAVVLLLKAQDRVADWHDARIAAGKPLMPTKEECDDE